MGATQAKSKVPAVIDDGATSSMSTAVPRNFMGGDGKRRAVVHSLGDLDTYAANTMADTQSNASTDITQWELQAGGTADNKYEPYFMMERLWRNMTAEEQATVVRDHQRNFY